jgi:hypothetical protein
LTAALRRSSTDICPAAERASSVTMTTYAMVAL